MSESQHSTTSRHSSGQAVAFGVVGYSETTNEADPLKSDQSSVSRDGQIQKVRVTEKVIPRSPQLHLRSGSNISQEYSDDAGEEIIVVSVWKARARCPSLDVTDFINFD